MDAASLDVYRYNRWGFWHPIFGRGTRDEFHEIVRRTAEYPTKEAQAVYAYCAHTGFTGIEFVALTRWSDPAPFRILSGGCFLVPCADSPTDTEPIERRALADLEPWQLYDGWLAIRDTSVEAVLEGLEELANQIAVLGYEYGLPTRWLVKYVETVGYRVPRRTIGDAEFGEAVALIETIQALPITLRNAVTRAIHWHQHAEQSSNPTERFLAVYYALETLCLALWDHADDVGLTIGSGEAGTKRERAVRRDDDIRKYLDANLASGAVQAVTECYFSLVVPIRRRVEAVIGSISLPENDFLEWLYRSESAGGSPSTLRSALVHGKAFATEPRVARALTAYYARLANAVKVTIAQVVQRAWDPRQLVVKPLTYTARWGVTDTIWWTDGEPHVSGDFRVTTRLLASKNLL